MSVKRRRPESAAVPEKFARFVRSEYAASLSCEQAVQAWAAEREIWAEANSYEWYGCITSPLGDVIDRLIAKREARLLMCIRPDDEEFNGRGLTRL